MFFRVARFLVFAFAALLLLPSCSVLHDFFAEKLRSKSGLYDVKLKHTVKMAVDGYWVTEHPENVRMPAKGRLYIAPLDCRMIEAENAEHVPELQSMMHAFMTEEMAKTYAVVSPDGSWGLTEDEKEATLRIDMALTRYRTQMPVVRVAATAGGAFVPVPFVSSAVSKYAKGDITIEGTLRDARNGELLFAFQDTNREDSALYKAEGYYSEGNAEANFRRWSQQMARLFMACAKGKKEGTHLEEMVKNRSWWSTFKAQFID